MILNQSYDGKMVYAPTAGLKSEVILPIQNNGT